MGLVRNLRKKLSEWAEKILVELSYHYIIQKEKQTSKKRNNSLLMESSLNHLTTERLHTTIAISSQDISEKITMETQIEPVAQVREWSIKRLEEAESIGAKSAIYEEFEDWIELEDKDEIEYISLEDQSWVGSDAIYESSSKVLRYNRSISSI